MEILLIEDNETIIKGLSYAFQTNNYKLVSKKTCKEALNYLKESNKISLIILDITLPDGNGFYLYEDYIKDKKIPTIFLSANDDENTICKSLDNGAEDYITKPFSTNELLIRVKKILLRFNKSSIIKVSDIQFDLDKMIVLKNDKKIDLTPLELKILSLLFVNVGKVITRDTIIDKIWEITGNDVYDHTVTVYLKRIREKLGTDIIKTIKGVGYMIDEE